MDTLIQVYQNFVLPHLGSAQSLARRDKTISITAAIVLATFYLAYSKITKPPKNLRGLPTADNILLLKALMTGWSMRDVANKITIPAALKADHGLYVRFDQHGWIVHIQDPTAAKKFLLKADKFPKFNVHSLRVGTIPGKFFDGPNILFTNGEKWKGHRKIANPAFHRSMPVELFGRLSNKLFKVMDGMGTRINFHAMMTNFTLDAIGLAGFDFNFNAIEDPESDWVRKYHSFSKNMWNPVYLLMPWLERNFLWLLPERRKIHQDLDEFLEMLDEIIIHKRQVLADGSTAEKDNEKDLLTLMIESENKGEGALTNEELKSNICIFFLAGHDTTANALSFAIYYLAKHPEIQEKARQEAIAVFGDEPHDILPTLEQVKSLKYINCVIKETLRINPPAGTIVARYAAEDEELNGVVIPKGAKITLDIYELHHNPRVWKNPEEYNPDRFLEGGEADQNGAMSWLPFSTGSRQCIGMNFSLAEQRVLLPLILRKYTWTLPEDSPYKDGVVTATGVIQALKSLDINFKRRY